MKEEILKSFLVVFGTIMIVSIFVIVFTLPTMFLWNWLMPTIFGLAKINLWQTMGLIFLAGTFFKNFNFKKSE